ncbi:MAG: ATP-binding protein [Verrucomicrobiota bacterium]
MKIQLRFILVLIFVNLIVATVFFQLETLRALKDAEIYQAAQQLPLTQFGLAHVKFLGFILSVSTLTISIIIYLWLVRPLILIISAMSKEDPSPLLPLIQKKTELGKLAKLAYDSFEDKKRLEREIKLKDAAEESLELREEQLKSLYKSRERLLRDLHDDTIQSLFALGLRIESGFSGDPAALTKQKSEFQKQVNDVIGSLRAHLEDSPTSPISGKYDFSKTIYSLAENLEKVGTCKFNIHIDDQLESILNAKQGHEITAIATEAFSNALRHGLAKKIRFHATSPEKKWCHILVEDDGIGCNLKSLKRGKGLTNIEERVRELEGNIILDSSPQNGLKLNITLPLIHK